MVTTLDEADVGTMDGVVETLVADVATVVVRATLTTRVIVNDDCVVVGTAAVVVVDLVVVLDVILVVADVVVALPAMVVLVTVPDAVDPVDVRTIELAVFAAGAGATMVL